MTKSTFSEKSQFARELSKYIDQLDAELLVKCAELEMLKAKRDLIASAFRNIAQNNVRMT